MLGSGSPYGTFIGLVDGDARVRRARAPFRYGESPLVIDADASTAFFARAVDRNTNRWREAVLDRLTVRVSGDPLAAAENLRMQSYWSGSFSAPFRDFVRQPPSPK